jgi:hypothetical protein
MRIDAAGGGRMSLFAYFLFRLDDLFAMKKWGERSRGRLTSPATKAAVREGRCRFAKA